MSAQFSNGEGRSTAIAVAPPLIPARWFDQWIAEIEDNIDSLEDRIRELSLEGEDIGPASFNLQKLQLLLEIAREAKARV
jgi:hypothetical protein